ncbi:capsular exopolysaccharide family [Halothece sp. PCC 7418]|uniref:GumC family protein n=1 Tax=Halothece sp. (strain PCC 7418) TaxID=65093 RepID=UPI0002A084A3|nr:polysaccharide biosynthesis tyrosine autokinase [Halothece sp. PCC 7418]AFZ44062.1 capsular exopolysaccharide family [Halothece sp. PCC 7418]
MTLDPVNERFHQLSYPVDQTQGIGGDDEGGLNVFKVLGALRRQSWVIVTMTLVCAALGGMKAATDTPIYKAQFELLAEPVSLESQVISSTTPESLSNREDVVAVVPNAAKLKILRSPRVLEPLVAGLQQKYPNINYKRLARHLDLSVDVQNQIIQVEYKNPNRQQVQDVLEAVKDAYLDFSLEVRQLELNKGLVFVEKQLPRLRSRVDQVQARLQWLREDNNFIDPTMEAEQLSEQIGTFVQQRLQVQAQLNEAQLLAEDLEQQLSEQSIEEAMASALNTPRYEALLDKLQEIDTEIAEESATFTETSPQIQTLQQQREQLLPLLQQEAKRAQKEVESQIRSLEARDRALFQTIARLNERSKQLSATTRQYTDLKRELEIASNNLNQFLTKREALGIDVAQSETPWEVLTPPSDPVAVSASVQRNLVLGTALGLLLGVGTALMVDRLRDLVHSTREIQEVVKFPLLGNIPFDRMLEMRDSTWKQLRAANGHHKGGLWSQSTLQKTSVAVESFRSIYTNIRLLNPDVPVRAIVISSAMPQEGKSTVATHLAKAAAAMGRRVLLVDADLRRPQFEHSSEDNTALGLTDLIDRQELNLTQVIQPSPLEENLFFLGSGQIPPDPSKLIASEKMQRLMIQLQSEFDLVIYDTTILRGFTDAHLLATGTNGLILVTGIGRLKRSLLERTVENLTLSRTPILGIVGNGHQEEL